MNGEVKGFTLLQRESYTRFKLLTYMFNDIKNKF